MGDRLADAWGRGTSSLRHASAISAAGRACSCCVKTMSRRRDRNNEHNHVRPGKHLIIGDAPASVGRPKSDAPRQQVRATREGPCARGSELGGERLVLLTWLVDDPLFAHRDNGRCHLRASREKGATGLEPATSGVIQILRDWNRKPVPPERRRAGKSSRHWGERMTGIRRVRGGFLVFAALTALAVPAAAAGDHGVKSQDVV